MQVLLGGLGGDPKSPGPKLLASGGVFPHVRIGFRQAIRVGIVARPVVFIAALLLLPGALGAQVIEGLLVDAEVGLPIQGATVVLMDTDNKQHMSVVTDARGRFVLEAPEPGDYMLWAERGGYASVVSPTITLAAEQVLDYELKVARLRSNTPAPPEDLDPAESVARFARSVAARCEGRFDRSRHGIIVGTVTDSVSDVTLPGVFASVEWAGEPDTTAQVRVEFDPGTGAPRTINRLTGITNTDGGYVICNAPADRPLVLRVEAGDEAGSQPRVITVRAGTMKKEDVILGLSNPDRPGDILGRVLVRSDGEPVVGAVVRLKDTEFSTLTSETGAFSFTEVPWGIYVLEVEHIAYASTADAFRVQGGRGHQIDVLMTEQAIALDPITVTVHPRAWFAGMRDLEHRIAMGFGYILTRKDLEIRGVVDITDALRGIPGVRVVKTGLNGSHVILRNSRNAMRQPCSPTVWMDGIRVRLDPELGFNDFVGLDLEAVEVYRSAAETPGEFASMGGNCGAIVLWTRRGR